MAYFERLRVAYFERLRVDYTRRSCLAYYSPANDIRLAYGLGCRYRCDFCTIQTIARRPQFFSAERVLTELALYRERFCHDLHVYCGDETFTQGVDALTELLPVLRDAGVEHNCQTCMSCLANPRLPELLSWGCR